MTPLSALGLGFTIFGCSLLAGTISHYGLKDDTQLSPGLILWVALLICAGMGSMIYGSVK